MCVFGLQNKQEIQFSPSTLFMLSSVMFLDKFHVSDTAELYFI